MGKERSDYEQELISMFRARAKEHGRDVHEGQGVANRIVLRGNVYFQFGDLRVDTPGWHVVVEAESAGGVTNLAKYWYLLEQRLITKPVRLLHVFRQQSAHDYLAHLEMWDLLYGKMQSALGDRFVAKRYRYRECTDLEAALADFDELVARS